MKNLALFIIAPLIFLFSIFVFFYTDEILKTKNFESIKPGMQIRQVKKIMKTLALCNNFAEGFVETYYPLNTLNKYIVIYNKKDSVVTGTWKEY